MRKFDTKVQHLKYKVLREVARLAWEDKLLENIMDIPKMLVPGNEPTMRCCVYKERAQTSKESNIWVIYWRMLGFCTRNASKLCSYEQEWSELCKKTKEAKKYFSL